MSVQPVPINVYTSSTSTINGNVNQMNLIGNGHMGATLMDRIVMSLKSNVASEVEWALASTYQQSFVAPDTIDFEKNEYLGKQLIKYFMVPFRLIQDGKADEISNSTVNLSLDALLSIRNSIQDITNQQWLSQIYEFKQDLADVLKLLVEWIYKDGPGFSLGRYKDQFVEYLFHTIDILDTLTCYYINNPKTDELFNLMLFISTNSSDKYLIIGSLNCLTHLLFTKADTISDNENKEFNNQNNAKSGDESLVPLYDNCIDNFTEEHLEHFLNYLLLNDPKLNVSVLDFIKQYLNSGASDKNQSLKESKFNRLSTLLQINSSKKNLHTLLKQLPVLLTTDVMLNEPITEHKIEEHLAKRSNHSSVPSEPPLLSSNLYDIISKFPEPMRSSVWLRCCYEPIFNDSYDDDTPSEGVIGEVTQISLWKAYEKQFEPIWKNKLAEFPELLPAVDFIKNVTNAFPNSEAMVVMLKNVEPPKKKFIIRGIQPRQFAVDIDVANYEALKKKVVVDKRDINEQLPIGSIDTAKFQQSLESLNSKILFSSTGLKLNKINLLAKDILDYIISQFQQFPNADELVNIFRLYNRSWLLQVVYSNPVLVEIDLVGHEYIKYLI
ncbi:Chromatin structure-remodeling complex protein rsc9 [Yamadazyma tenuis]|uniref:RFX-type winged-helix domain-containing protein n=1 Tax=Candida tenuis (strain ATCC 10573 / BCRC 21748 / CBS 615 / JCM 9827 / NBRC 10315 / NRRL Y-1498 / VKM Y-70) TaxID=590646 RepID=G3B8Z3_CANTC|nr:uncharacterized protein CANTEDRAFT_131298 [Yamadazyma tenuis ATCC 10573]EGV61811.1 hypothetical protein CANTEDRAFT_131298 [Yamadazyma tenuis ATCC 10573]WEJ93038.1 Chromatin structure-remodeling complex protein rsc9 [Yamadazyma tenuis]